MEGRIEDHMVSMEGRMVSMEGRMVSTEDRMVSMEARLRAHVDQRCARVGATIVAEFRKCAIADDPPFQRHSMVSPHEDFDLEALAHRVKRGEALEPRPSL
jgi:hypothetical protein